MSQIQVTLHGTIPPTEPKDLDGYIGAAHAQCGQPIEVRITRGNQVQVLHLSIRETSALEAAIRDIRNGAISAGSTT